MQTAFSKFKGNIKTTDIKKFLCAGINACIENEKDHYTPFQIGKLLDITKLGTYAELLTELLTNAMPQAKETEIEENEEGKN